MYLVVAPVYNIFIGAKIVNFDRKKGFDWAVAPSPSDLVCV